MPYTTAPFLSNINGPGDTLCTIKPPNNIAVAGSPGIPSDKRGIIAPPIVPLFALSDATTPSIIPVPNFSGCFDEFFATV